MNGLMGLSTILYDTITDTNNVTPENHTPEIGGANWVQGKSLSGTNGNVIVSSNAFTNNGGSDEFSLFYNLPKKPKKVQFRLDHNSVSSGDFFIPIVSTSTKSTNEKAEAGSVVILMTGSAGSSMIFQKVNSAGTDTESIAGASAAQNTGVDIRTVPHTLIVEYTGTIIKAYLAVDPSTYITVDTSVDSGAIEGNTIGFLEFATQTATIQAISAEA